MANIELLDQMLGAFFQFMEENPVLWSNNKKYPFQKKQKWEEPWQRLILHPTEQFPDSVPHEFTCKYNFIF